MTPAGLFSTYQTDSRGASTLLPSTTISSRDGSTNCPVWATAPFTRTRPAAINSSAFLRDATPARASARWMRIVPLTLHARFGESGGVGHIGRVRGHGDLGVGAHRRDL